VSELPVAVYHDDGEDSRCQQLLAVYEVRRRVERLAPRRRAAGPLPMVVARARATPRAKRAGKRVKRNVASERQRAVGPVKRPVRAPEDAPAPARMAAERREITCYLSDTEIYWRLRRKPSKTVW
jgi:hypothetical protein